MTSTRRVVSALAVLSVVGLLAAAGAATAHARSSMNETAMQTSPARSDAVSIVPITATGSGSVTSNPDTATITLGVMVTAKTSVDAQDRLNRQMESVLSAIKALKLAGMTIQTQWVNLQPQYDYNKPQKNGQPEFIGYQASNTVSISVAPADAGKVIDASIDAGGNQLQGISFSLKNDASQRAGALASAAQDARAKADAIAGALGLRITRVIEASTGVSQRQPRPMYDGAMMLKSARAEAAPTPIEAGELTVSAEATVVFAAEPK